MGWETRMGPVVPDPNGGHTLCDNGVSPSYWMKLSRSSRLEGAEMPLRPIHLEVRYGAVMGQSCPGFQYLKGS